MNRHEVMNVLNFRHACKQFDDEKLYDTKYEKIFKFMSRMGVLIYLLGTSLTSYLFMVEENYDLLLYKEVSTLLHILFVISIITSIFICRTSSRYRVSFILIILSSVFFIMCLYSLFTSPNPWHGDGIKIASYNLMSNLIIIISITRSCKKYRNSKKLNAM